MANIFNVSFRRVGGLRFLKVGRLTVTLAVSRTLAPRYAAKPVVEASGDGFKAIVKLYRNGRLRGSYASPELFGNAGDAMAHATAGIVACNMQMVR